MTLFGEREELFGSSAGVAAVMPSFDLGPTAREAGAWTRLRRRFAVTEPSGEPLFSSGSFDSELLVDQAGSLTHLRRSLEAAEVQVPLPQLSVAQLGALLGVVVISCAVARPWTGLQGKPRAQELAPERAPQAISAVERAPRTPAVDRTRYQPPPALGSIQAKLVNGEAALPAGAPKGLQGVVAAANQINEMPYVYGGGHGSFVASGYDCSGAVSYALHGGGLLDSPLASGSLAGWGSPGEGKAITVYANGGHAYAVIAGLRWDTSGTGSSGPRWHQDMRSTAGYVARHPSGY